MIDATDTAAVLTTIVGVWALAMAIRHTARRIRESGKELKRRARRV